MKETENTEIIPLDLMGCNIRENGIFKSSTTPSMRSTWFSMYHVAGRPNSSKTSYFLLIARKREHCIIAIAAVKELRILVIHYHSFNIYSVRPFKNIRLQKLIEKDKVYRRS